MRLLPVLIAVLFCSCQSVPRHSVTHVVVFWLKDQGNAAQRARIIETSERFRSIPGVLSVKAGPCIPSERPVVDSSYDVALTMEFADRDALQRYLQHPMHKEATDAVLKPMLRKIAVFDFGGE